MASSFSMQPEFVLRGFLPQRVEHTPAGAISRTSQHSLLSKQLQRTPSTNDETAASSCSTSGFLSQRSSDPDSDDGLCCDHEDDCYYAEEAAEGFSAPIPICVDRRSRRRQRELLQRLEFLAQIEEMKYAAERYNAAQAGTFYQAPPTK